MQYKIGIDIGSTTIKCAVLTEKNNLVYSSYERHYSFIKKTLLDLLNQLLTKYKKFSLAFTGSGAISVAELFQIPMYQEVIAGVKAIEMFLPQTDIAIELGGEDAKITYITNGLEQRMNGSCAGGTGAFIDQMATLLATNPIGLNKLAKKAKKIYPIASRCGVFAKSDIQPLLNDGATKEDLAASIFQAVVNQTITSLSCGRPIKGKIAFLGGPLHFLDELVNLFVKTLQPEVAYVPKNSEIFNAIGASLLATQIYSDVELLEKINNLPNVFESEIPRLPPLFLNEEEKHEFFSRHNKITIPHANLENYKGSCFLGIDAGSTTTKIIMIDDKANILYEYYGSNKGEPLNNVIEILKNIYEKLPSNAFIKRAVVTGYGEKLLAAALKIDEGIVETIAHYIASEKILPNVDFILDIGGQDMKCMKIKDHAISDIILNEACSSGCGSFIESFAKSNKMTIEEFANLGIDSKQPVDLGSRCTVFMNSRIKQAQKEGATLRDISAGLSYSIIKNTLYKVIKLRDLNSLGDNIIVQGGTFLNSTILRALEKIINKNVTRPPLAGLMGAYGCALVALKDQSKSKVSSILKIDELNDFKITKSTVNCNKCSNNCLLTITEFQNGSKYVSNNRCEKGEQDLNNIEKKEKLPNMYQFKYNRLFNYYKPLINEQAERGTIGIPRVLNMYENYPFWFTFFTALKYKVILSPNSTKKIYELGMDTIPSDSACYPAKLVHGHIKSLIKLGCKTIFYPCIPYEQIEDKNADNHYNCPIVGSYPDLIKNNMENELKEINFISPFLPYYNRRKLIKRLCKIFPNINKSEIEKAIILAYKEDINFKKAIKKEGERIIKLNIPTILLAGRPYHLDHEINHGIPEMVSEKLGYAIITEDSIKKIKSKEPLRVVNQWTYHARLYNAAEYIKNKNNINLVQLNSFGCGLDAITTDQVQEILKKNDKLYTTIKIDEVNNLGAVRIRLRSLIEVLKRRTNSFELLPKQKIEKNKTKDDYVEYKKNLNYTLLAPQMSPIHMPLLAAATRACGHNVIVLPDSKNSIEMGLKYVNNDSCYPSIIVIGQIIDAILSGKFDTNKLGIILTQTGGGCRATNYIPLLRKALKECGYSHIPVISFGTQNKLEKHSGFGSSIKFKKLLAKSIILGDLLMRCLFATRPYEVNKGDTNFIFQQALSYCKDTILLNKKIEYEKAPEKIVSIFEHVKIEPKNLPKIGLVGEILVKYHPIANNHIVDLIEQEGGEVIVPDLINFFTYGMYNEIIKHDLLASSNFSKIKNNFMINYIENLRIPVQKALKNTRFGKLNDIRHIAEGAKKIVSLGNMCGEGWFLTGEIIELIENNINNIICVQPFACLPNHVTGKGVMKKIKNIYKNCNLAAIDYDPGASEVNQLNRIKLLMANAKKNL